MQQVRILHVTEYAVLGGEQYHILTLLRKWKEPRFQMTVCSNPKGPFVHEVKALGVPHVPFIINGKYDITSLLKLMNIFKSGRYHIVHLHGSRVGLYGRIAAKLASIPIIVWTMHAWQTDTLLGLRRIQAPLYLLIERILSYFCDKIIAESDTLQRRAIDKEHIDPNKIVRIYAAIDLNEWKSTVDVKRKKRELGIDSSVFIIGTVGRLVVQKGTIYLLQAARTILQKFPNTVFVVVGDGPLRKMLEQSASDMGIGNKVVFTGYRKDVPDIMRCINIFVLPTLFEGFGLVFAEAMIAGRPIVATTVDPIPEVVRGYQAAILVPPRNHAAIAQALLTIMRSYGSYEEWGKGGKQIVKERYSSERMVDEVAKLYEDLISRKIPHLAAV